LRDDEVTSAAMVTKEFPQFSKPPKNRINLEVRTHTSAPFYHDGPVWQCTGAFYPCTAANHRESISACRRDVLGVANSKSDTKATDHACPQHSCAREGALRRAEINT
jgi:hypothetical protein